MNKHSVLRSPEVIAAYAAEQAQQSDYRHTWDYQQRTEEPVREFTYWRIVTNLYPYDKIAETHDLLAPKRIFGSLAECTPEEWAEYLSIKKTLATEGYYDCILENFPKNRSVMKHLHLHLMVYKT